MEPSGSTPMIWRKQFPLWLPCHPAFWEHSYLLVSAGRVTAVGVTLAAHTWLQLTADWVCCSPLPGSVPFPADRMLCCFWPLGKPGSTGLWTLSEYFNQETGFPSQTCPLSHARHHYSQHVLCQLQAHKLYFVFPLPP